MNSEPISSELLISLNQFSPVDASQASKKTPLNDDEELFEVAEDSEESAFTKAATLMMSLEEEADLLDSSTFSPISDASPKYYVQGVVSGQRAFIITNLLGGESQTLFQSQMVWTIGRNREAALPLRDRVLSRRHAVILYLPSEGFYLVDLNSMNGSFVNGVRLQQRKLLKDGDRLRMGSIEFSFFASHQARSIEPIHPEVLARFTTSKSRSEDFIDYLALEEPEVLFGSTQED